MRVAFKDPNIVQSCAIIASPISAKSRWCDAFHQFLSSFRRHFEGLEPLRLAAVATGTEEIERPWRMTVGEPFVRDPWW